MSGETCATLRMPRRRSAKNSSMLRKSTCAENAKAAAMTDVDVGGAKDGFTKDQFKVKYPKIKIRMFR